MSVNLPPPPYGATTDSYVWLDWYNKYRQSLISIDTSVTGITADIAGIDAEVATKLSKNAADILDGEITFGTSGLILAGTATNGVYMGPNGIVGVKASVPTFTVNTSGDAYFAGELGATNIVTGSIRGGATNYSTGTGFWQGYDVSTYKWRVGNPTGARAQWDGSTFAIYDSNNVLTIASGSTIGGGNLLANSSFELDSNADGVADSWAAFSAGTTGTITNSITTSKFWHASSSQVASAPTLAAGTGNTAGFYQDIDVDHIAGQPIRFSAYMQGSFGRTLVLQINVYDASNAVLHTETITAAAAGTSQPFQRLAGGYTLDATADRVRIFAYIRDGAGTIAILYVDAVQIEIGDVLTAYAPSARDKIGVDNQITSANASTYIASAAIGWAQIGNLDINANGYIRSVKPSYGSSTAGFYMEYNGGTPRLDIGNSTKYLRWSGSDLLVGGDIIATGNLQTNAATRVSTVSNNFAGATYGTATVQSLVFVVEANGELEFTAKVGASNVLPDSGNIVRWVYSIDGGGDVIVGGVTSADTARKEGSCAVSVAVSSGTTVTFSLKTVVSGTNIAIYDATMRATLVKK